MKRFIKTLLHNLLLAFLAFVWLVPIVWLVVTSFSAYTGMNTSTFFPKEWSLAQYKNLLFHHCMCGMCDLHRFCTDGGLCDLLHAFPGT